MILSLSNTSLKTTVDDDLIERFPLLFKYTWYLSTEGYVCLCGHQLHQILAGTPPGYDTHHKNFDKLDNRVENLTFLTPGEHRRLHSLLRASKSNTPYKGVSLYRGKKYRAYIKTKEDGKLRQVHLGYFDTAEEAARQYDKATAIYYPGMTCYLNNV